MDMLGLRSHIQESARQAAGSFLTPLTNAIAEQRRLVDSLALVSKIRVEECRHMMTWSKYQTEDLGDVLLKLNLLIRKISDYEIRFGTQYEGFREKVKYLRTKDDTLCEMGRRQTDLQTKIVEASKSRLRTAKAMLLQKELEKIQKESEPQETKLQTMKRKLIKDAYTDQLNAIIELGAKMQIIGEHGKQLLDHIDLTCSASEYSDGHETEGILQEARIALESWEKRVKTSAKSAEAPVPVVTPKASTESLAIAKSDGETAEAAILMKPKDSDVVTIDGPPLPPRSSDVGASNPEKPQRQKNGANEPEKNKVEEKQALHDEDLRRREEFEFEKALELSLTESTIKGKDLDDLNLSAEELQFVMSGMESQGSDRVVNKPVPSSGSTKDKEEPEQSLTAAKAAGLPKVVKNTHVSESNSHVVSQQAPRPWVSVKQPKKPEGDGDAAKNDTMEELAGSPTAIETMGESTPSPPALTRRNTAAAYYRALSSMDRGPPMESMGSEPPAPLESMGTDSAVVPESMGQDGEVPFVAMPVVPPLDDIRRQKIQISQRKTLERQLSSPFPLSPELQYLQVRDSPHIPYQPVQRTPSPPNSSNTQGSSLTLPTTQSGPYQAPAPYRPTTTYVPHANKHKNRLSDSFTPSPPSSLSNDSVQQTQLASQKAYQLAYHKSYQQSYQETYQHKQQEEHSNSQTPSPLPYSTQHQQHQHHQHHQHQQQQHQHHQQHQQQQKQLQDFYYTPGEQAYHQQQYQQYQQQNPGAAAPPRTAWNWGYPVFNPEADYQGGPSPSPSHISLIPVSEGQSASPNMSGMSNKGASTNVPEDDHSYKVEL
ncbi:MAG: Eisosome component PIL1-domain-containing protein [Benniella sp.]|nr:MAG: Eisosome component PIL1-domain-containing protein [Benniella sp.]